MRGRLASLVASTSLLAILVLIVQHPAAESRPPQTPAAVSTPALDETLVGSLVLRGLRAWVPVLRFIGSEVHRWFFGEAGPEPRSYSDRIMSRRHGAPEPPPPEPPVYGAGGANALRTASASTTP